MLFRSLQNRGRNDLIVSGAAGRTLTVMTNDQRGGWGVMPLPDPVRALNFTGRMAAYRPEARGARVLASVPAGEGTKSSIVELRIAGGELRHRVILGDLPVPACVLAVGDFDGDGTQDLFVGGGAVPGRVPASSPSHLYRNKGGEWMEVGDFDSGTLVQPVTAALFADLDRDGLAELVVATA